jgi:hypothetical protein
VATFERDGAVVDPHPNEVTVVETGEGLLEG